MSDRSDDAAADYLEDLDCGAGCTEIWEHLNEVRRNGDGDDVSEE